MSGNTGNIFNPYERKKKAPDGSIYTESFGVAAIGETEVSKKANEDLRQYSAPASTVVEKVTASPPLEMEAPVSLPPDRLSAQGNTTVQSAPKQEAPEREPVMPAPPQVVEPIDTGVPPVPPQVEGTVKKVSGDSNAKVDAPEFAPTISPPIPPQEDTLRNIPEVTPDSAVLPKTEAKPLETVPEPVSEPRPDIVPVDVQGNAPKEDQTPLRPDYREAMQPAEHGVPAQAASEQSRGKQGDVDAVMVESLQEMISILSELLSMQYSIQSDIVSLNRSVDQVNSHLSRIDSSLQNKGVLLVEGPSEGSV